MGEGVVCAAGATGDGEKYRRERRQQRVGAKRISFAVRQT